MAESKKKLIDRAIKASHLYSPFLSTARRRLLPLAAAVFFLSCVGENFKLVDAPLPPRALSIIEKAYAPDVFIYGGKARRDGANAYLSYQRFMQPHALCREHCAT